MSCCDETGCRRTTPILVRRAPFADAWVALTRYRRHGDDDRRPGLIEAQEKHLLPAETQVEIELGSALARGVFDFAKARYVDADDGSEAEAAYRAVLDEFERVAHDIETRWRGPAPATESEARGGE